MVLRECAACGEGFKTYPSIIKQGKGRYCSRKCGYVGMTKKVEKQCEFCGAPFITIPADTTRGHGRYCSHRCRGLANTGDHRRGENCWNWRGGRTSENYRIRRSTENKEWREAVFARDNWTCQDCGARGGKLHAHHVFTFADYPEHRFDTWNGVTLCKSCHYQVHSTSVT